MSEFAISVRDVGALLSQSCDDITQTRKRSVNILCFFEPISSDFGLVYSLTTSKVHQVQVASKDATIIIFTMNMYCQDTVKIFSYQFLLFFFFFCILILIVNLEGDLFLFSIAFEIQSWKVVLN